MTRCDIAIPQWAGTSSNLRLPEQTDRELRFELMSKLGLTAAFTFDQDFRDCGFEMLP